MVKSGLTEVIAIMWQAIRRNMAVTVLLVVSVAIWIIIGFPAVIGAMAIALGIEISAEDGAQTTDTILTATAGIGLALLAAGLSGIVFWLGRIHSHSNSSGMQDHQENSWVYPFYWLRYVSRCLLYFHQLYLK